MVESLVGQQYDDANWTEFPPTVSTEANFILNNTIIFKMSYILYMYNILYIYKLGSDLNVSFELVDAFMFI